MNSADSSFAKTARRIAMFAVVAVAASVVALRATACPFCTAVSQTFSEEIGSSDAAVIAKLMKAPPRPSVGSDPLDASTGKATFAVVDVLKGGKHLAGRNEFEAIYFGDKPVGSMFLVMAVEPPGLNWSTPIAINDRSRDYLKHAIALPKEGPDRLAYFLNFLEDHDEMLSRDAYDEFAKAPYSAVKGLKERMPHEKILGWIRDTEKVPTSRRRLYLTMLAVCGKEADIKMLEEMLRSSDRQSKSGLDAMISAYLTLKGPSGIDLVEELFLKNKEAEYTDTYGAITAIRFQGQEEKTIPRERLTKALRYMLDRPELADLVITDLARWEDWSAMDRLVELFKNADDESSWVRVPVINYLQACPKPEAKAKIAELAKIAPDDVARASTLFAFGGLSQMGNAAARAPAQPIPADVKAAEANKKYSAERNAKPVAGGAAPAPAGGSAPAASPPVSKPAESSNRAATEAPAADSKGAAVPPKAGADKKTSSREKKARALSSAEGLLPLSGQARRATISSATTLKSLGALAVVLLLMLGAFLALLRGRQHVTAS